VHRTKRADQTCPSPPWTSWAPPPGSPSP